MTDMDEIYKELEKWHVFRDIDKYPFILTFFKPWYTINYEKIIIGVRMKKSW